MDRMEGAIICHECVTTHSLTLSVKARCKGHVKL